MPKAPLGLAITWLLIAWVFPAAADQAIPISICALQGTGFSSPYLDRNVRVQGVVTADFDQTGQRGFYIQSPDCDSKSSTSDGVFIYLAERVEVVSAGDRVRITGQVKEYYGMTEISVSAANISMLSHDNPLPSPRELNPPFEDSSARSYFESLEGMVVHLSQGRAVGPTDSDDRTWLVRSDLGVQRVFHDDAQGTGEVICADDEGLYELTPEVKVGDEVNSLTGVLDFRIGQYCIQLTDAPQAAQMSAIERHDMPTPDAPAITLATFNLEELFDTVDNPANDDRVLSMAEYQRRLEKRALAIGDELGQPALLAVQEAENRTVLADLIDRPEIQAWYQVIIEDGPDVRGLDVALLYRPDRASVLGYQTRQACTALEDGFEPDGNDDPQNPQNDLTCDLDGDGILDGNRLFSRPPLVVHLLAQPGAGFGYEGKGSFPDDFYDLWLVVCHFKSKVGDSSTVAYTLPRRVEQARFVAGLVREIRVENPSAQVVVLGDLNDHPDSQPLAELMTGGLINALDLRERDARYSYIYTGISQTLDYILFAPQYNLSPNMVKPAHINADYPESYQGSDGSVHRSSDHDPLLIGFSPAAAAIYLPLVIR